MSSLAKTWVLCAGGFLAGCSGTVTGTPDGSTAGGASGGVAGGAGGGTAGGAAGGSTGGAVGGTAGGGVGGGMAGGALGGTTGMAGGGGGGTAGGSMGGTRGGSGGTVGGTGGGAAGGSAGGAGGATGGVSGGAGGGSANYFTMDCALGRTCGFSYTTVPEEGTSYNTTIVSGACPSGRGVLRTSFVDGAPIPRQFYFGVANIGIGVNPRQGMTLYGRWRARVQNRFAGANGPDMAGKFIIIGDGGGAHERVIINLRDNGSTPASEAYNIGRNVDAPSNGTWPQPVPAGSWVNGQFRIRSSTGVARLAGLARSGTVGTATTVGPHPYRTGQRVEVRYAPAHWENVHTITEVDSTHFTFPIDAAADPSVTPGTDGLWSMSADAHVAIWLNAANASESAPTAQSTSEFGLSIGSWVGATAFGGYFGVGSSTIWSPPPVFDMCDFQLGPRFDSAWNQP